MPFVIVLSFIFSYFAVFPLSGSRWLWTLCLSNLGKHQCHGPEQRHWFLHGPFFLKLCLRNYFGFIQMDFFFFFRDKTLWIYVALSKLNWPQDVCEYPSFVRQTTARLERKGTRWRWLTRRCSVDSQGTCRRGACQQTQGWCLRALLRALPPEPLMWWACCTRPVLVTHLAGLLCLLCTDGWVNIDQF